jgi:nicotinate-nucleotide pyrophosphorylase (carboxylating)
MIAPLPDALVEPLVRAALAEDFGRGGDVTSDALIPADARLSAVFAARVEGRMAGLACSRLAFAALDPDAHFEALVADGADFEAGAILARVEGSARAVLSAERVALNFLGRLCGVATLTRAYVDETAGTKARIVCTRKTTPGLRVLEKYAVRCGGGVNHRFGLDDAILIKDNHIAALAQRQQPIAAVVARAKAAAGHLMKVEVEVDTLGQLDEALAAKPDVIMLDNFSVADMLEAVRRTAGAVVLEASGGVSLKTVRAIAETGVDAISVGALTHSAPVLDIGLDITG